MTNPAPNLERVLSVMPWSVWKVITTIIMLVISQTIAPKAAIQTVTSFEMQ